MEIKTGFSSQFNHDAAIKGSGLLGMFFFCFFFVPGAVYKIKKNTEMIFWGCFFFFFLFTFTLNITATNNESTTKF